MSDPNWIIAAASIVMAIASAASAWVVYKGIVDQNKNFERQSLAYRLALSADIALKFEDRFNEPTFVLMRSNAALAFMNHMNEGEAEHVFDFFDTLGLFVRVGALTVEVAHSVFFHWVNLYWSAGKPYIEAKQKETSAVWGDFGDLYYRLCEVERGKDPKSEDLKMSSKRLSEQLQEEINLANQTL